MLGMAPSTGTVRVGPEGASVKEKIGDRGIRRNPPDILLNCMFQSIAWFQHEAFLVIMSVFRSEHQGPI